MDELIESIYETLKDYRADNPLSVAGITKRRIRLWINQFEEDDQETILQELDKIFKDRYCSKENAKQFLNAVVTKLTKELKAASPVEFLKNTDFLSLQIAGKSQGAMLELLNEVIQENYDITLAECGSTSHKYSVYIDDILCTGTTFVNNITDWCKQSFSPGKTNKQAVEDRSTKLIFAYIFIHEKNYFKKKSQLRRISAAVADSAMWYRVEIQNGTSAASSLGVAWPLEENQPAAVGDYREKVINDVDEHTQGKYPTPDEFYRPANRPVTETLFTNRDSRIQVENAFLSKGIEILNAAAVHNNRMRALGYSLPSHKNFGFGALCFTWRNIPNNAPLVFWYAGGGFTPLFKVQRRGNSAAQEED